MNIVARQRSPSGRAKSRGTPTERPVRPTLTPPRRRARPPTASRRRRRRDDFQATATAIGARRSPPRPTARCSLRDDHSRCACQMSRAIADAKRRLVASLPAMAIRIRPAVPAEVALDDMRVSASPRRPLCRLSPTRAPFRTVAARNCPEALTRDWTNASTARWSTSPGRPLQRARARARRDRRHDRLQSLRLSQYASLEAQAAAIADDIAYDAHDIDDGLRAELF